MGQILGKALPFATILSLLTALGFVIPLIQDIQYGPFEFDIDVKDVDIFGDGVYNFTLKISVKNQNATEVTLITATIGMYYDAEHYSTISQYFIDRLIIPAKETTVYYVDGRITLQDDNVPKIVYVAIEGKYALGGNLRDINYEQELDLEPYWP